MHDNDGMQDMTAAAMMIPELRKVLKRLHYALEVMLVCARWYAAYPLNQLLNAEPHSSVLVTD